MDSNQIALQKEIIEKGNTFTKIIAPCTVGNGIVKLSDPEKAFHIKKFEKDVLQNETVFFIPASGSGSRMFGFLLSFKEGDRTEQTVKAVHKFLDALTVFPFYDRLTKLIKIEELDFNNEDDIITIIDALVDKDQLDFLNQPKALIPFHLYDNNEVRSAIEEQIIQGVKIVGDRSHKLNIHFTVQENHRAVVEKVVTELMKEKDFSCEVNYSSQKKSTDAVVFYKGEVVKLHNGETLKRPSGHGALIENLNEISADLIFIRNIDNIPHLEQSRRSIETRKIVGSYLNQKKEEVHAILKSLHEDDFDDFEVKSWIRRNIEISEYPSEKDKFRDFAIGLLNRPIRVCGMVKNTGQPGGGPFWIKNEQGVISKQIVEKAQINLENKEQRNIFEKATHFNPVDIACAVRDYKGKKFDLLKYIDSEQYFVVHKNNEGKTVQFVERPGLWNGSMANWLTFFIETSNNSFCPVKTVLDLVSPQHLQ